MCAIIGALVHSIHTEEKRKEVNDILVSIWASSHKRGRDGRGYLFMHRNGNTLFKEPTREENGSFAIFDSVPQLLERNTKSAVLIGNLRAEPTTEFVAHKNSDDQQPYSCGKWSIVHNGTIANDKELRINPDWGVPTHIDSAAIAERLSDLQKTDNRYDHFKDAVRDLKGSFAILAVHSDEPDAIYVACNYRPVWYVKTDLGMFFASSRYYLPADLNPQMMQPYSVAKFDAYGTGYRSSLRGRRRREPNDLRKPRALVVCSGGLDSVVAAASAQDTGYDIELIHFQYGSRAEGPEVEAVRAVAKELGVTLTLFPLPVYDPKDSPLLQADDHIAGGEAGAEFAHEWVPARNLVMLSVATAFAEARGIQTIVLGNNLEEAGAYPDNEPEFVDRFNDLLPFAVGDGKRVRVIMPVGNLMKHEIVALGHKLNAPMHLTWSCYRAGKHHCGTCGPCFMRRKAFDINKLPEVISYVPVN